MGSNPTPAASLYSCNFRPDSALTVQMHSRRARPRSRRTTAPGTLRRPALLLGSTMTRAFGSHGRLIRNDAQTELSGRLRAGVTSARARPPARPCDRHPSLCARHAAAARAHPPARRLGRVSASPRPASAPAALDDTNALCAERALPTPFVPSADRPFGAPLRIARVGSTPPGATVRRAESLSLNHPATCGECQLVLALPACPLLS